MTEMQGKMDSAGVDWARRIPLDQISSVLAFLAARLLAEGYVARQEDQHNSVAQESKALLTAGELAERLNLPESWIRNEERLGRIPSVRAGKYVRFRLNDVERALAERKDRRP
jgi:excisionase family DNA binding protein